MEEKQHPTPLDVAHAFVKQFYVILNQCPQNLHKFYQEQSLQGWPKADGVVIPVTTLSVTIFVVVLQLFITKTNTSDFVPSICISNFFNFDVLCVGNK